MACKTQQSGTIIRIADWFGITHIYCSQDTADVYNPKVVQATMGSIARVKVEYGNLLGLVESLSADVPVYGTLLDGENIYQQPLENRGLIVMGNEGKGISPALAQKVNRRLLIPNFPEVVPQPTASTWQSPRHHLCGVQKTVEVTFIEKGTKQKWK